MLMGVRAVLSSIGRIYVLVRYTDFRTAYQVAQATGSKKNARAQGLARRLVILSVS